MFATILLYYLTGVYLFVKIQNANSLTISVEDVDLRFL